MDCLFLEHARGFIILNDYYKAMEEKQSFLQDSVEHISPDVDPEGNGKEMFLILLSTISTIHV